MMVMKRALVIPTVRVVHVCPPIVVHTDLADFRAVVQELTGWDVKNTTIMSMRSSSNEHFDKLMVSESIGLSSPVDMQKSNEEEGYGSCAGLANDVVRAYIHDHQNNHMKKALPYDAWIEVCGDQNGALLDSIINASTSIDCNNGTLSAVVDEEVWPLYEDCLDGPTNINEEVCIYNEAVRVVSSCNDSSSPNWTATSSYSNCISKKREEDMADIMQTGAPLSDVLMSPPRSATVRHCSERRPGKKAKLTHSGQESHQHLLSNIILNTGHEQGFITPHSSLFPSEYHDLDYLHAGFFHPPLPKFEESSTEVFPFSVSCHIPNFLT